ncbi:MAG: zinc ribbon domain-containing protein [Solirubrobacterales bacterium]|nr:zinc ribbon domain-containing protein [Solirubrobacterales bacterium]
MFCPRCAQESEKGDRFCPNCGEDLSARKGGEDAVEKRATLREQIAKLIGTTRNARLATVGTLVAVAIAVVAFAALRTDEDEPQDQYTETADPICAEAKRQIAAAQPAEGGADQRRAARSTVLAVALWRARLEDVPIPVDRVERAVALDDAMLRTLIDAGALARGPAADETGPLAQAEELDAAIAATESAIDELGLDACAEIEIAPM